MNTAGPSSLSSTATKPVPTPETFSTFHAELQSAALKATRASAGLPIDLAFYTSVDGGLKNDVGQLESRVLALIGKCLALANGKGKGKELRVDGEDVIDDFHSTIVDSVDILLEKTDICLDEYSGKLKRPVAPTPSAPGPSSTKKVGAGGAQAAPFQPKPYLPAHLQHASNIGKPQLAFRENVDNSDDVSLPHLRFLKHKFNARLPLGYVLQKDDIVDDFTGAEDGYSILPSHPYYFEITHLEHPSHVFNVPSSPDEPSALPSPVTYVSTASQFDDLLAHLTSPDVHEIAVDLEHHSYRTYRGFLCLMQITTRQGDFIVDLLVPEVRARMHELNEVFTNPSKIKIFHGAESDVVWLQHDFGIYLVGLFDTFHASKLLDLPRHSLATLLQLYADYTPDKRYQLADWRIRPLPEEMLLYAQSDTHWLLYLYDRLRGALVDKEASTHSRSGSPSNTGMKSPNSSSRTLLQETLFRSSQTSLRQYSLEIYDEQKGSGPGGWDSLAKKWNKASLTYVPGDEDANGGGGLAVYKVQRSVYRAVHGWRDRVAREEDESTRYVLPNHFLFALAEAPPADMGKLLGMFRGGAGVPALVKKRAAQLLEVVRDATRRALETGSVELVESVTKDVAVVEKQEEAIFVEKEAATEVDGGIWGTTALSTLVATSSALLGGPSPTTSSSAPLSTTESALFGSTTKQSFQSFLTTGPSDNPAFKTLVSKINSTLVIAPSVPKTLPSSTLNSEQKQTEKTSQDAGEETIFDPALGMQIDAQPLAYVPASKRASTAMEDMGPIVVVGRKGNNSAANRKKRKRDAVAAVADEKQEEVGDEDDEEAVLVEMGGDVQFDFAGTSNVLDKEPSKKKAKGGKKADGKKGGAREGQPKGAGYFYGDFGAPPKARSEVKGGNKSFTFK